MFDDRNAFAPTEHIWVSEKIDWVQLDDGLPQHQETQSPGSAGVLRWILQREPGQPN